MISEKHLSLPLSEDDVRSFHLGDAVRLSGVIYTARDEAHMRILGVMEKGDSLPVDFKDSAVFHCGPIMQKNDDGWKVVAAGPTTSSRMNALEPGFIEKTGVRAVIGKGGMNEKTLDAMKKYGCVYLAMTGGAALVAADHIKGIKGVYWAELGEPEAVWVLEVEDFGPLTVAMDAHGGSIYEDVRRNVEKNLPEIKSKLGLKQ